MKDEKIKGRPKRQVDKRGRRTSSDGALAPIVERKFDNSKNADEDKLARVMRKQAEKEKHLFPLRINATTVIFVPADKCNEKYREEYLTNKYRKL
jgi:hypothetical protein